MLAGHLSEYEDISCACTAHRTYILPGGWLYLRCDQYPVKVPGRPGRISCQPGCRCREECQLVVGQLCWLQTAPWRQKREDYHCAAPQQTPECIGDYAHPKHGVRSGSKDVFVIISHAGHDQSATPVPQQTEEQQLTQPDRFRLARLVRMSSAPAVLHRAPRLD